MCLAIMFCTIFVRHHTTNLRFQPDVAFVVRDENDFEHVFIVARLLQYSSLCRATEDIPTIFVRLSCEMVKIAVVDHRISVV